MFDRTEIQQGKHNGKEVWICALSYTSYANKPLRHTKPTKVMVAECPGGQYYDQKINFKVLKRNGECSKKIIRMYPNVDGYRNYPVTICNTEEECETQYKLLCINVIDGLKKFVSNLESQIEQYESNL